MAIETSSNGASRRRFITAAGAASVALAAPGDRPRASSARRIKVSVGRQPWAAGNSPVTHVHDHQQDVREATPRTRATT